MTQDLTQDELKEYIGESAYMKLVEITHRFMRASPEYNNGEPFCASVMAYPVDYKEWPFLIIISTSKTLDNGMRDFGIIKAVFSTTEAPDFLLDWVNDEQANIYSKDETKTINDKAKSDNSDYLYIPYK